LAASSPRHFFGCRKAEHVAKTAGKSPSFLRFEIAVPALWARTAATSTLVAYAEQGGSTAARHPLIFVFITRTFARRVSAKFPLPTQSPSEVWKIRACRVRRGWCVCALPCAFLVSSPVGGEQEVNTVEAIWMKNPSEVDDAKYDEFYKFIAKAYDEPLAKVSRLLLRSRE